MEAIPPNCVNVKPPRLLFVSHSATRNGATILLLHLLRWLRANTNFEIEVLVNGTGELVDEFRAIGKTIVWRNPAFFLEALPRQAKSTWKPRVEARCLHWRMTGRKYDLAYFNTSAVAAQVTILAARARTVLWHLHELEYALRLTMGEEQIRTLFPLATRFVVVSESVRDTLVKTFGVRADQMDLINGFVSLPEASAEEMRARRLKLRRELGWGEDAFVVGGCGSMGWRKGTDVFLQIADAMRKRGDTRARFLWVGGGSTDETLRFEHDLRSFGLGERCRWVPTTAEVLDYYHAMDVFALTSREDPFPLVMLEAGACGLPTVCFSGSGGGPEYVGGDAGLIAPYLDVAAFAKHLETLRDDSQARARLGAAAAEKVRRQHVVATQGPKLLQSIQHCLAAKP
jgi:glycosyltransferase involved in cell wall biosynthesis